MATRISTRLFQTIDLKLPLGVTSPTTVDLYYSKRANTLGEFFIKPLVIVYDDGSTVATEQFARFKFVCPQYAVDDLMQIIEANIPTKQITYNAYRDNEEFKFPILASRLNSIFEPEILHRSLNYKKYYYGRDEGTGYWYSKNATTQSLSLAPFYKEESVPSTIVPTDEDKDRTFMNKTSKLHREYHEKLLAVLHKYELDWATTYNQVYNDHLSPTDISNFGDIQEILNNYKQ